MARSNVVSTTTTDPSDDGPSGRLPARRASRLILSLVVSGYGLLAIVGVAFINQSLGQAVLSTVFVVGLLGLQVGYLSRVPPPRAPWSWAALGLQAVLVFLPIVMFGPVWHGLPGLLAGSALLLLPRAVGVPVFAFVVVAIAAVSALDSPYTGLLGVTFAAVYAAMSATSSGLAVFGLSVLVRLVAEAHEARDELRRTAVARERTRLAQQVQAVLGQSLSAIALRGELIARLIGHSPERARAALAEVLALSRQALTEVRTLVGLRQELDGYPLGSAARGPIGGQRVAPRVGWVTLAASQGALGVTAVIAMALERGVVAAVVLGVLRVGLIAAVVAAARVRSSSSWSPTAVLVLIAAMAYLPQLFLGPLSRSAVVFVAGAALLLLSAGAGVAVSVAVMAAVVVVEFLDPTPSLSAAYGLTYILVAYTLLILVIYGLGSVPRLIPRIDDAREELAAAATAAERVRVARDVHDLLGLGLSTITLKCDLADKLIERAPDRARDEVADVLVATRTALADVRTAVGGEGRLSLDDEWRAVVAALESAAVEVRESRAGVTPDHPAETVLATVLREGITNVLRHSAARWCDISIRGSPSLAVLEIVNDGAGGPPSRPGFDGGGGGHGLRNMAERVRSVGGDLDAARDGEVFRLRARVPARP